MALIYYVTSDVDTYFVDPRSGQPLAGGILTFYQNSATNVMVSVYEQTGTPGSPTYTALPNPLTLSNVGTVQDASGNNVVIYYLPNSTVPGMGSPDLYYVVITDSGGNPVATRYNWPNITSSSGPTPPPQTEFTSENQLSNPTFTNSFLAGSSNTYVATGTSTTYPLCPDWNLIISGSGNVTVNITPVAGNTLVPSSPPYVLDIAVDSSVSSCIVAQNFYNNSGLWTSTANENIYLNGAFVASNLNSGTTSLNMWYAESTPGYSPIIIVNGSVSSNNFAVISGSTASFIPDSANPATGPSAYVTVYLSFSSGSHVQVSGLQLIVSEGASIEVESSDYNSSNRNEAFQADYYIPRLAGKPIPSYLVGWDFSMNPFQFGSSSSQTGSPGVINPTAKYIADQTIAQSNISNVNWQRDSVTNGLNMTGTGTNDAFYILQYLSGSQVQSMINNHLSINVYGYIANNSNPVTMKIYLFSSTSTIPRLSTGTIGDVNASGNFTISASGWNQVSRSGLPTPSVSLNTQGSYLNNDYGFNLWQMPNSATAFAIVVTFAYVNASTVFTINSISVVPGDIPCRPAVQSSDEVLRQCSVYYQTSFVLGQLPANGVGASSGEIYSYLISPSLGSGLPMINFPVKMRALPNPVILYNPVSNNSYIRDFTVPGDFTTSAATNVTTNGFITIGRAPTGAGLSDFLGVHFSADARIGIV